MWHLLTPVSLVEEEIQFPNKNGRGSKILASVPTAPEKTITVLAKIA
jgi:hypothetical protein